MCFKYIYFLFNKNNDYWKLINRRCVLASMFSSYEMLIFIYFIYIYIFVDIYIFLNVRALIYNCHASFQIVNIVVLNNEIYALRVMKRTIAG